MQTVKQMVLYSLKVSQGVPWTIAGVVAIQGQLFGIYGGRMKITGFWKQAHECQTDIRVNVTISS